ncbi:MAG: ROK family protein [Acholeplasmatales bacterium]|nr:ROK family protein [Acholeplasmatales bacterium]
MRCGVDVGGTTVKLGFVEGKKIVDSFSIVTKKETLFDDIFSKIVEYTKKNNIELESIGFGIPGIVRDNYIVKMPNIAISGIDLNVISKKYFPNVRIKASNDANCAALGEAICDTDNVKSSYFITLGTGVGGGYVYDGKVVDGVNCACGEIGHMFIDHIHNFKCGCGLSGCLETVTSATGIVRLAKKYYSEFETKIPAEMSAKDVFDCAKEGDQLGVFVLNMVSEYLAKALANLAVVVDCECFYIGGGVSKCGSILTDCIKKYYDKYSFYATKDTKIKLAKLGNDAGMIGASYL